MASKAKKVTVRSFKITNTQLSENSSGILSMLKTYLLKSLQLTLAK